MSLEIKESDWWIFRRLHPVALERFCQQVIEELNRAMSDVTQNFHERYLEVFRLIMDRNEKMRWAFNDMRRSKAIILLTNIKESGLLTEEEFLLFSPETREAVEGIIKIRHS